MISKKKNKQPKKWYDVREDIESYPLAWLIICISKRGCGKTYSALKYYVERDEPILYVKRTNKDVDFILRDDDLPDGMSPNPYAPLNMDMGWNIRGKSLGDGFGIFGDVIHNDEDKPDIVKTRAMVFSLNAMKALKGFNLREVKAMIFDEFIPQVGEVIKRAEGEMALSMYMTVNRAREKLGQPPLKLILFANSEQISTPITNELEVTDDIANLCASGQTHLYLEDRGILIHHITDEEIPVEAVEEVGIAKAMKGTAWYDKNFEGDFSGVDFSNVMKMSLKGMRGYCTLIYRRKPIYIYLREADGMFYACRTRIRTLFEYDLSKENEQKSFYYNHYTTLKEACIEGRFKFQTYTMYDLLVNYRNFFKL